MNKPFHKKRICPVCGTEFQPERKTKVYCGDLCRGRAYLLRKEGNFNGIGGNSTTLNHAIPASSFANNTVSEPDKPNHTLSFGNQTIRQEEKNISEETINSIAEKGLEEHSEEESGEKAAENNANHTLPFANQSVRNNGNHMLPFGNSTLKSKEASIKGVSDTANPAVTLQYDTAVPVISGQSDEAVQYKGSSFIAAISETVKSRGLDEAFVCPYQHWPHHAGLIREINKYLRCLLNNTLSLSRHRKILYTELRDLTNAYFHVINSRKFEESQHPYSRSIDKLHRKLKWLCLNFKLHPKLRIVLRPEEKAEIIAMLHEIGNTAEKRRFSELFRTLPQ